MTSDQEAQLLAQEGLIIEFFRAHDAWVAEGEKSPRDEDAEFKAFDRLTEAEAALRSSVTQRPLTTLEQKVRRYQEAFAVVGKSNVADIAHGKTDMGEVTEALKELRRHPIPSIE